jgi:hypothetical protein
MTPKLFSNNGKMIDMSKVSVINAKTTNGNSLVLLPDGKIKNLTSNVKVSGKVIISSNGSTKSHIFKKEADISHQKDSC